MAMHGHSYFFSLRRHLNINFSRDLNGSGTQGLFIKKQNVDIDLIKVIFDYTDNKNDDFLYEADLIKDQRKDYEPTVNRGKHRFVAKQIELNIDWNGNEIQQWRADIEWICPYISRHLLSLNPLLACCRRYSRGER
ncbi:hypothetical protein JEX04_17510 [Escherichia coli]|uniref:hypothetical protein n=1 Tax=Escherichia coli TaxID=562 RepID=UPI002341FDCA|nr:hypothetical protein [Escherichia coli]MDC3694073.1 hypothetical protein [Escherichia coli]MDC3764688.1 hypothetical protein [Escherichia coli]MDC3769487.1 hypothetical protein [Escherichia coli]MDC3788646.1 hypothetical protein [Escherichia coli]HCO6571626.1 hypothetical protein [Escherichia coli]